MMPPRIREARRKRKAGPNPLGLRPRSSFEHKAARAPWHVVSADGVLLAGCLYEAVARRLARVVGGRVQVRP